MDENSGKESLVVKPDLGPGMEVELVEEKSRRDSLAVKIVVLFVVYMAVALLASVSLAWAASGETEKRVTMCKDLFQTFVAVPGVPAIILLVLGYPFSKHDDKK